MPLTEGCDGVMVGILDRQSEDLGSIPGCTQPILQWFVIFGLLYLLDRLGMSCVKNVFKTFRLLCFQSRLGITSNDFGLLMYDSLMCWIPKILKFETKRLKIQAKVQGLLNSEILVSFLCAGKYFFYSFSKRIFSKWFFRTLLTR